MTAVAAPAPARVRLAGRRPDLIGLAVSWGLGLPLALLCAWVALSMFPGAMLAMAVLAMCPALWYSVRAVQAVRHRPHLTVTADELVIRYDGVLRAPLQVPLASVRAAELDAGSGWRFRVHASSSPHFGSEDDDVWLWSGGSPIPRLAERAPNLVLLFEPRVPVPSLRRERADGPMRGEHLAAVFLEVADVREATATLGAVVRPLTMPDLFLIEEQMGDAREPMSSGSRLPLVKRHLRRWGWLAVAGAALMPLLALFAVFNAFALWNFARRAEAAAMGAAAVAIAATRLAFMLV